jgi:Ser/Thr protein kinase RdoA (MazF antagonist)
VARDHGIACHEPIVLHDLFSLRVHLAPAPIVARVPTWIRTIRPSGPADLRRELAAVAHLHDRGVPVVQASHLLPAEVHEQDGHIVTFWNFAAQTTPAPTNDDCRTMLGDLHAALADFTGAPMMIPDLFDPTDWLANAVDDRLATDDEAARLRTSLDEVDDFVNRARTATDVIHGDVHAGNLLRTAGGLVWNDLEEVSRGPLAWDHATLAGWNPGADASPEVLAASRLRAIQVALCLIRLRPAFGDTNDWEDAITTCIRHATRTHD